MATLRRLDGYQSGDPGRAYMLTAALWSAVAELGLTYANPPTSFEEVGQKTRRVGAMLSDGLATCLDSTLLFASAIEAVGLNPVIIMTQGHCFAGVWLVEKTLKRLIEPDCSEVRKALAARELITFETTLATHRPASPFADATTIAAAATRDAAEANFVAAVDIRRARMAQIRPLASHTTGSAADATAETSTGPLPLPPLPDFGDLAAKVSEERPTTPAGRIDRWQRKLLDLSLRNRLLNFRPTKLTIPVLCPEISALEDKLAEGGKLRLLSLPDHNPHGERDAKLHEQRTRQDLDQEFARQALTLAGLVQRSFAPLQLLAKRLYPAGKAIEEVRRCLRENLAGLELSPELQIAVEEVATALDVPLNAAKRLREAARAVSGRPKSSPAC